MLFEADPQPRMIRLDLENGAVLDTGQKEEGAWLVRDDLLFVTNDGRALLVDLTDGVQTWVPRTDSLDSAMAKLTKAEKVFAISGNLQLYVYVLGLARDYKHDPQDNTVFYEDDPPSFLNTLTENGVRYEASPPAFIRGPEPYGYYFSLDEHLYADWEGVRLSQTGQLIVATGQTPSMAPYRFGPKGWVLDNHAVVYQGGPWYVLNGDGSIFGHDYFPVPQPILLLEVPPQYWVAPTPVP